MAKSNLLKTSDPNLAELLAAGRFYTVPPYQRDYSWSREHWEDLWNDIRLINANPDERHYMGALVVQAKTDRDYLIIDGQQRMATLTILALAVIHRLEYLSSIGTDEAANRERAEELRRSFIGEKNLSSLTISSKLHLNETDDAFFQDHIVNLDRPKNIRKLPGSNRGIWNCYQFFMDRIASDDEISTDGDVLSGFLKETIARRLLFILITVEEDLHAYVVFETLNARGLELSASDLLKNYLFSLVEQEDIEAVSRKWKQLVTSVGQANFPEFLRHHLLTQESQVRKQQLFAIMRAKVKTPLDVMSLLKSLEPRAHLHAALNNPNDDFWTDYDEAARLYVEELNLFRVTQITPLLFSAHSHFESGEFIKLLKLMTSFTFRYSVICQLNPNELEQRYPAIAKLVEKKEVKTARGVFEHLRQLYPSDERFRFDFSETSIATSGPRQKLAKYILSCIEIQLSEEEKSWKSVEGTIEHILPENLPKSTNPEISPDEHAELVYRLGNMMILESKLNRDAANKPFKEKLAFYGKSKYFGSRELSGSTAESWDADAIGARQKAVAKVASAIWKSDFVN